MAFQMMAFDGLGAPFLYDAAAFVPSDQEAEQEGRLLWPTVRVGTFGSQGSRLPDPTARSVGIGFAVGCVVLVGGIFGATLMLGRRSGPNGLGACGIGGVPRSARLRCPRRKRGGGHDRSHSP